MAKQLLISILMIFCFNSFANIKIIRGETPNEDSDLLKSTVSLMSLFTGKLRSFCTGTVLNTRTILTAAHCIAELGGGGIFVSSGRNANDGNLIRVSKFKYFSNNYFKARWGDGELGNQDIAILITDSDLDLLPIKIGNPLSLSNEIPLLLTGYDVTSVESEDSDDTSLNDTGILYYIFGNFFKELEGAKVTVSEQVNQRTASGDSGGPLYLRFEDSLEVHGVLSNGSTIDGELGTSHESEYTHPFFYKTWMNCALPNDQKLGFDEYSNLNQVDCDLVELQDIERLGEFNKMQCEQQQPGFSINGEYGCMPASLEACIKLGERFEIETIWDEEALECTPVLGE